MSVSAKLYHNAGNRPVLARIPESCRAILDVGCGAGDNARALVSPGRIIDGITLSEREAEAARRAMRTVQVHNLENGLPDGLAGTYDCAICSHVLEHICWPTKLLTDLHAKLRPHRGRLIVALPNIFYYKQRWELLRGRFQYQDSGLMDNTHFRWYSLHSARQLLEDHHYDVLEATGEGDFPQWKLRRLWPSLAKRIDQSASVRVPGVFGWQLILVARPKL